MSERGREEVKEGGCPAATFSYGPSNAAGRGRGDHGRGEGGAIAAAKLVSQCPGRARRGAGAGQMPELKPGVSDLLSSD